MSDSLEIRKKYWAGGVPHKRLYFNIDGVLHREDGPAVSEYSMSGVLDEETYYKKGEKHRLDGPAWILYKDGGSVSRETYFREGMCHREDGPARIFYNKDSPFYVEFWLDDKEMDFWEFYDKVSEESQKVLLKNWLPCSRVG
jgi:antitoxin component YwqK of YwqJK toxin-antitoxin module